jgi:hypothetical protein
MGAFLQAPIFISFFFAVSVPLQPFSRIVLPLEEVLFFYVLGNKMLAFHGVTSWLCSLHIMCKVYYLSVKLLKGCENTRFWEMVL